MIIRATKNDCGTYSVQVGSHVYEMSDRATQPNGVCIYVGMVGEGGTKPVGPFQDLLREIPVQIAEKAAEIWLETKGA